MSIPNFEDGNCRDADTELFFGNEIAENRQIIRTYCKPCPIAAECLEWALEMEGRLGHSARSGIYGGTLPRQRWAISAARNKGQKVLPDVRNHGTDAGYRAHRRRGEQACQPCRDAMNLARRLRAERKGDAA